MRALQRRTWGSVPEMVEVPIPVRQPGYSLVRIDSATVGHLDATIATGAFAVQPELPYIPGVEGAGVVLESDTWPTESQVIVRGAGVGVLRDGTWCEIAHVPDDALMEVPAGMEPPLAACFFVPATTAFVALHDVCGATADSVVVVTGATGAVGSLAVQLALDAGCTVAAITRDPARFAGQHSSQLTVCGPDDDVLAHVGGAANVLIDTVAGPGLARHLRSVAPGGKCALVGYASDPEVALNVPNAILGDVMLIPVNMLRREARARQLAPSLAARIVSGDLTLPVTEYPPVEVASAIAAVAAGHLGGRATLDFTAA